MQIKFEPKEKIYFYDLHEFKIYNVTISSVKINQHGEINYIPKKTGNVLNFYDGEIPEKLSFKTFEECKTALVEYLNQKIKNIKKLQPKDV